MVDNFKDYLTAVKANKYTLSGYISILSSVALGLFDDGNDLIDISQFAVTSYGVISLVLTGFGMETLRKYKLTKKYIEKYGAVKERYLKKVFDVNYIESDRYCSQMGIKAAMKEFNLENLLKKYGA